MSDDLAEFDERMMRLALEEAEACLDSGDVPVGAVIARDGELLAAAGNARERMQDPTAHAEVLALREASELSDSWRLDGCTMYVTLEPCAMCAGAIVLARIDRVVFGARDPKAGFAGSLGNLLQDERLNHRVDLTGGLLEQDCGGLLRTFFRDRR
ncbi:MAG: tRNA adenosine(34) deaminase TadA [Actinomycetota bacterium]